MTASAAPKAVATVAPSDRGDGSAGSGSPCTSFLISLALVWLFPILWTFYTALRPYGDTAHDGYVSIAAAA